jgi:membrane associated rhomboid family serine protease
MSAPPYPPQPPVGPPQGPVGPPHGPMGPPQLPLGPPQGPVGPPSGPTGYPVRPAQTCSWHPDRATGLTCARCGRPACPQCLTPASVGFHCRACVAQAQATQRTGRTVAGGKLGQRPLVSMVLIGINLAFFVVTALQARSVMNLAPSSLFVQGALVPAQVASGEYWRLVSAGFLHENLIHIGTNMISLYILGLPLERILGRARFVTIYLLSLLGSAVSVMLFSHEFTPTIGASGAIYGLMGALVVTFRKLGFDLRQLLVVVALNVYITFSVAGISWQGHLGGFVVGAVIGAAMVYPPQRLRREWLWGSVIGMVIVLMALLIIRDGQIGEWYCAYDAAGRGSCLPAH